MLNKLIVSIIISCSFSFLNIQEARAQWLWLDLNFDGYNGTAATIPSGAFISWHSVSPASFYTSTGNFGLTAPAYKFGNDSDYITTLNLPVIDSISFWIKGNGGPFSPLNELRFYISPDSINYTLFYSIDSLPTTGTNISIPFTQIGGYLKIEYSKAPAGGNLAFDDFKLYSPIVIGINEISNVKDIHIFPSPTTGLINIQSQSGSTTPVVEVYDMLGNKMQLDELQKKDSGLFTLNLNKQNPGFYFIKIRCGNAIVTKRITLTE